MICRGLKNNKITVEQAEEKYQEFLELDLLDEDHQEVVEELIAEALDDLAYWDLAKKDLYRKDFEDDMDENELIHGEDDLKYEDENSDE
jgi:hypothetical protein